MGKLASNEELERIVRNAAVANTNLYNSGLTLPGCGAAYRAALFAGGDPETAWEAARLHMMVALYPTDPDTHSQRLYQSGVRESEAAARKRALDRIEQIRALRNPWSLAVAA